MTLVLSLVTRRFVCHVSDRQLTDLRTGRPLVSRASKTVIVPAAQFMVSYTGLAKMTRTMTTDEWLMRTCWELRDSDDYFGRLAEAASDAFAAIRLPPALKRHSFVVSGWLGTGEFETDDALPDGFELEGYCTYITNSLDFAAGVEVAEARSRFEHRTRPLYPNEKFTVFSAGATLNASETAELDVSIAAAMRAAGGKERAAAMAMLRTVGRVAARDRTVGGGAFICALPRNPPSPQNSHEVAKLEILGVRWGLPQSGRATFVHIPDGPTNVVESPGIIADPFAGRGTLRVDQGVVSTLAAGLGTIPEAAELKMNVLALRSSEEIARMFTSAE